jgi:hypothetical protein
MSANKEKPHLQILPEDDANKDLANGFSNNSNLKNPRAVQVMPVAGGWKKVADIFQGDTLRRIQQCPERRMILLLDFDDDFENRKVYVDNNIPGDIKSRVFVLGVSSEPEKLKKAFGKKLDDIGSSLADECAENKRDLWAHDLLKHNESELDRLAEHVRPFLFK